MIGIKDQCFGVEIELTGIARAEAAEALAAYFETTPQHSGDCYDSSEAIDSSNVKIMVVDNSKTKGNKVYLGTAADIKCASAVGNLSCSKVFVHYRYLTVKDIVVYK